MYKECKTTQSAKRQMSIAQTLSEMMIQQPYDEISVSSLCKKADIPRKSFYRYFDTKDDAFNYLIDKLLVRYDEESIGYHRMREPAVSKELLTKHFENIKEQRTIIAAIASNHMSIASIQRICETVMALVRERGTELTSENEMKITVASSVIFAMIMSWHHSGYEASCEELAEATYKLLTKPLIAPDVEM